MDGMGVSLALEQVAEATKKYETAMKEFRTNVNKVLARLIHEAIANGMSIEQFSSYSGMTIKQVRALMRNNGLDPKNGKNFLAHSAALALQENADLLGVDISEMDLTSPLAYLPMGSELRDSLAVKQGATDLD